MFRFICVGLLCFAGLLQAADFDGALVDQLTSRTAGGSGERFEVRPLPKGENDVRDRYVQGVTIEGQWMPLLNHGLTVWRLSTGPLVQSSLVSVDAKDVEGKLADVKSCDEVKSYIEQRSGAFKGIMSQCLVGLSYYPAVGEQKARLMLGTWVNSHVAESAHAREPLHFFVTAGNRDIDIVW